jgi:benzoyl-CoA reductase/2-hydroxyglutaryl-CoA dehydratase subunit BcrC/BadD/HgdB
MEDILLSDHFKNRPAQLQEARRKGTKVVGYFPGNYVPEELIYAAGAVPVCLTAGGSPKPADAALSIVPQIICPFARAQIGERILKENPYYYLIDMLVAPITCQHLKKTAEVWEYNADLEIFKLGIPHQHDQDFQLEYFSDRLRALKTRLQTLTGNEITDENLGKAIDLYNRMRTLFRRINLTRRKNPSPLSALDFIKLNHASYYADPAFMVNILASLDRELCSDQTTLSEGQKPRILLLGPCVGSGDYSVVKLVQAAGGEIIAEEIYEGMRNYRQNIEESGDLIESLAKGYLINRLPPAFMRNSTKARLDFTLDLIKDFKVDGVIWYQILCCETYDSESYYFSHKIKEQNIPFLVLESDYSTSATSQFKTRIEAFMEIVKGEI